MVRHIPECEESIKMKGNIAEYDEKKVILHIRVLYHDETCVNRLV